MGPARSIRYIKVVGCVGSRVCAVALELSNVLNVQAVLQPAVAAITLAVNGGRSRRHRDGDQLFFGLHAVVCAVDEALVGIGHPVEFTNDELLRRECIGAHGCEIQGLQIKQRDRDGRVCCANLRVADVQVLGVDRCNDRVVHEILDGEAAYAGLVEAQETEETSIWGEPERVAVTEDFLLVHPVRYTVEHIFATIICDLGNVTSSIILDVKVVVSHESNEITSRRELGVLDVAVLVFDKRGLLARCHVQNNVIGPVRVPVILRVVGGEQHLLLIGTDPVFVHVLGDEVCGDKCVVLTGGIVLEDKSSAVCLIDHETIFVIRQPVDGKRRGAELRAQNGVVEGERQVPIASRRDGFPWRVNGSCTSQQ